MELYPKKKTDEEYVALTRKLIKRSKWFGLFHALGAVSFLVMFEVLWHLIYSVERIMAEVSAGVHIGIMLGAGGGLILALAVQNVIWAVQYFKGQRTERLMVRYHDELRIREASNQASHATSEPAPGAASSAREG